MITLTAGSEVLAPTVRPDAPAHRTHVSALSEVRDIVVADLVRGTPAPAFPYRSAPPRALIG